MKRFFQTLFLTMAWAGLANAAPLKVVTSTSDLAWAIKEIGGQNVEVTSFLKGTENPHFVDAVPDFIRLAADAQLAVIIGLDLEVGWIPKVLARSGNAKVQPGGIAYLEAGKGIAVLEKPAGGVDRSMGDVHPGGNPHFWLSPKVFASSLKNVTEKLIASDAANASAYRAGLAKLTDKLNALHSSSQAKIHSALVQTKNAPILEYHKEFAYFIEAYGLTSMGSIEEKPGVAPSAGRLGEVAALAKSGGARCILAADTSPKKTLERFSEMSGLPIVQVPMSVQPKEPDYIALHTKIVDELVRALWKVQG